MEQTMNPADTIVAVSTPSGSGGIAVIRLSGPDAFRIADSCWKGKRLAETATHRVRFGKLTDENGDTLDECVATVFRSPGSYTGEDTVEFAVHGSPWIQREAVKRLVSMGARPAAPGEFTRRAFINGKIDLAQAEGVADVIASKSRAAHRLAIRQMNGTFSAGLDRLREQLTDLASLLELELDFSEEDVEFADRQKLLDLARQGLRATRRLVDSYSAGKALKEGVPVAIAGRPNAGKSTLLNELLGEEKAIVSDIPGTTRDVIEDTAEINGVLFRFFDTAGLRATEDAVERIGVERARASIRRAAIVLWLVDVSESKHLLSAIREAADAAASLPDSIHILLLTKSRLTSPSVMGIKETLYNDIAPELGCRFENILEISVKEGFGIGELRKELSLKAMQGIDDEGELVLTNARHHEALRAGAESLERVVEGLETGLSGDFIAQDLREALHHIAAVTGAITTDTLLTTIFSRFCIGK